ncbi:MAG: amino acid-binding protein [Desulfobacterales bacterium]|nr:MAG: amino acid-binding protein [Desulfobacterales bacterium]
MTMKQLTVLTGNSASRLSDVISHLSNAGIDIRAHCLVDNGDGNCKLRLIVSEPDKAIEILETKKLAAVVNEVVIVETDDKPGGLSRMLKMLKGDDIRIEYTYTAASELPGIAVMVFRFSDNTKAVGVLERNGLRLLKAS